MNNLVWKYSLSNHHIIKDELLTAISNSAYEEYKNLENDAHDYVSKTDYFINTEQKLKKIPDYYPILKDNLTDFFQEFGNRYCLTDFEITSYWFQQYHQSNIHHWHVHPYCSLSIVYLLELPDQNYATEFFDIFERKRFIPNVQEGDIIVFSSAIPHRCPLIVNDVRKTIISFNISPLTVDMNKIDYEQ